MASRIALARRWRFIFLFINLGLFGALCFLVHDTLTSEQATTPPTLEAAPEPSTTPSQPTRADYSSILRLQLRPSGSAAKKPPSHPVRPTPPVRKTAGPFSLIATSRHSDPVKSSCIVLVAGERQQRFVRVGDTVGETSLKLLAVGKDHVVVEGGGKTERIFRQKLLPGKKLGLREAPRMDGAPDVHEPIRSNARTPVPFEDRLARKLWKLDTVGIKYVGSNKWGLRRGDVVHEVDGRPISSLADLKHRLILERSVLSVLRDGSPQAVIWQSGKRR